jgi:Acetokinase family
MRLGATRQPQEFIAGRLNAVDSTLAKGRVVVAHLGSGCSMCALVAGRSVESSMAFSALNGLPVVSSATIRAHRRLNQSRENLALGSPLTCSSRTSFAKSRQPLEPAIVIKQMLDLRGRHGFGLQKVKYDSGV